MEPRTAPNAVLLVALVAFVRLVSWAAFLFGFLLGFLFVVTQLQRPATGPAEESRSWTILGWTILGWTILGCTAGAALMRHSDLHARLHTCLSVSFGQCFHPFPPLHTLTQLPQLRLDSINYMRPSLF
jgi:hypothetical protein